MSSVTNRVDESITDGIDEIVETVVDDLTIRIYPDGRTIVLRPDGTQLTTSTAETTCTDVPVTSTAPTLLVPPVEVSSNTCGQPPLKSSDNSPEEYDCLLTKAAADIVDENCSSNVFRAQLDMHGMKDIDDCATHYDDEIIGKRFADEAHNDCNIVADQVATTVEKSTRNEEQHEGMEWCSDDEIDPGDPISHDEWAVTTSFMQINPDFEAESSRINHTASQVGKTTTTFDCSPVGVVQELGTPNLKPLPQAPVSSEPFHLGWLFKVSVCSTL